MLRKEYNRFQFTENLRKEVVSLIESGDDDAIHLYFDDTHHADIAEVLGELSLDQATYIIRLLDSDTTAEVLMELDDDDREKILENLSAQEIAEEIAELDTDDAADIVAELSLERQRNVMSKIEDLEHKADIQELLKYDENSAGSLMAKELVKVNENWTVTQCVKEMRIQAEFVTRVHSIYVIDDSDRLIGRLSLKDLLVAKPKDSIKSIFIPKVDFVEVSDSVEDVSKLMQKYDLEAIPVVDEKKRLLGRITIDDIVDVIKEEAEKDYQLAAGITQEVEADDNIFELVKARLPWLILGLFGGLASVLILQDFEEVMVLPQVKSLFFFTPLVAAMAGNVGVQSSAIIVQGLANDVVKGSLINRLLKEVGLSLINGITLGALVLVFGAIWNFDFLFSLTVAISMVCVIIVAALIGTFVPILLHRRGIDPAIATGPFITTSNDIFGIFLFFMIAKLILQF